MEINIESFIFYILLIDALGANILAWSDKKQWWHKHMRLMSRYFPLTRGWTSYYMVIIVVMGWMLYRLDALVLPF